MTFPISLDITINGEQQKMPPITLLQLLEQRGLYGKRIAVEHNQVVVPKSQYDQIHLASGDQIEIIVAVGGG